MGVTDTRSPEELLRRAAARVAQLAHEVAGGEATRDDLDAVVADIRAAQRMAYGPRPHAARGQGATSKLLSYLTAHVGQPVSGEELDAISGIHEWPRRIRQLRVQDGYDITELGGSMYRLDHPEPDAARASRWKLLNGIRKRKGSGRDRIEALFEARVGEIVSRDELDYVARIKEGVRRARELRDEQGWPIDSHIDDPTLHPGEYRLLSTYSTIAAILSNACIRMVCARRCSSATTTYARSAAATERGRCLREIRASTWNSTTRSPSRTS